MHIRHISKSGLGVGRAGRSMLAGAAMLALMVCSAFAAEEVRIVRDDFGIPHIYAPSDEGVAYGMGWAQAEDRLVELLKNYRRAQGTMAEVFGSEFLRTDTIMRLCRHAEVAQEHYGKIGEGQRRAMEAFIKGVKDYMAAHPDEVPDWAQEIAPWNIVALSRYIIYGWPLGDAFGDLRRGGVNVPPLPYRGSNQWLIAPERTKDGAVLALIDPHLSWYDEFRFYEARLYGKTIQVSGVAILGVPMISLGHSQWCSIAMTTGSGDTADVFEEIVNPDNKKQYLVDGEWRDMDFRVEKIGVKQKNGEVKVMEIPVHTTHHGPVAAYEKGVVYSVAIPYAESVGLADQIYDMMTAKNLDEAKKALDRLELMGQNVMIGTVDGDIYYQRTGKVPVRPDHVDPSRPIPGHKSANDWKGIHKASELVQVTNPQQGYMHNCNVSPHAMMKDSPMQLKDYPAYVYGDQGPAHQRAAMTLEHLHRARKVTVDQAIEISLSTEVLGARAWQQALRKAQRAIPNSESVDGAKFVDLILRWNGKSLPDSKGATAFLYWKKNMESDSRDRVEPGPEDTPEKIMQALGAAVEELKKDFGSVEVSYGEIHRVGRRDDKGEVAESWPVGGGSLRGQGMATPRAITFTKLDDKRVVGRGGQTSVQIVQLTKPPRSWTLLPLGESDRADSPHFDDQAEKLFGPGKMKPTFFMDPEGLKAHTESETKLEFDGL